MSSGYLLGIRHAKTLADLGRGRERGMKSVVLGLAADIDLGAMKGGESNILVSSCSRLCFSISLLNYDIREVVRKTSQEAFS